ncbi:MAG: hypothetical protein RRY64_07950, partial [Oscillospiraceae bacterium]
VQWLIAMLFQQGKVSFTVNSQNISPIDTAPDELLRYITKREYLEKLLIEMRAHPSDKQMKSVREVMKDLFALPSVNEEDDALIKSFKTRAKNKLAGIKDLLTEYRVESRFPGKRMLESGQKLLGEAAEIAAPMEFFRFVDDHRDDFLDFAEDSAPVFTFFDGEQKTIVSRAWKYVDIFNNSKTYVVDAELIALVEQIHAIVAKTAPYSEIHKLPALLDKYAKLHVELIEKESAPVKTEMEADRTQLLDALNSKDYAAVFQEKFVTGFAELKEKLGHSNNIADVKNVRYESEALKQRYIAEMAAYEVARTPAPPPIGGSGEVAVPPAPVRQTKTVSLRTITKGKTVSLKTEQDVDALLSTLKTALLQELTDGDMNLMM